MLKYQPRIVVVTRKTQLQLLEERHGTREQARYYIKTRHQNTSDIERNHHRFTDALRDVQGAIPSQWRRVRVDRDELDRFVFEPEDIIVVVGQDGLVPNTAKYLTGQIAIGINPDPDSYDGVLCPHGPGEMSQLMRWVSKGSQNNGDFAVQRRTMAVAEREDGQRLLALNEVFIGHRTHQSARYRLTVGERTETHSSSGLILATGTGATGWAQSIARQRGLEAKLPQSQEARLVWFVREPFPSKLTGTLLDFGVISQDISLVVVSQMPENGVAFADGIESDSIEFLTGQSLRVSVDSQTLNLVMRPNTAGQDLRKTKPSRVKHLGHPR